MKFYLQKQKNNYFLAYEDSDFKKILKIDIDEIVECTYYLERNYKLLKKFFKLLERTIYHMNEDSRYDRFREIEPLRREVLIQGGFYDEHETLGGKKLRIPWSISYEKMDEEMFQRVYSKSVDIILKYFLPDISKEDFEQDLLSFI